jgi:Domain of Unknown Function (DUF1206)
MRSRAGAVRLPILLGEDPAAMRPASRPVRAWLLAQAAVYALASWTTLRGAVTTTGPIPATALDQGTSIPWARELVLVVGLVFAGAGAILTPRGVRYGRSRDVVAAPRRLRPALLRLGRVGAVTRGLMFLLPGLLLVAEAWSYRRGSFGKVSDGVRAALQQPWGRVLLVVAAAGLAAFALYELAAAAYRREPPAPVLPSGSPGRRRGRGRGGSGPVSPCRSGARRRTPGGGSMTGHLSVARAPEPRS